MLKSVNSNAKITIHHSKYLTAYLLILVAFACGCTLYAIPPLLALFILPCILFYGRSLLRQHAWRDAKHAIVSIEHYRGQRWIIRTASLQNWQVIYNGSAFRSPWLLIARFAIRNRRNLTVVIVKDAVCAQNYTDLLARLWI